MAAPAQRLPRDPVLLDLHYVKWLAWSDERYYTLTGNRNAVRADGAGYGATQVEGEVLGPAKLHNAAKMVVAMRLRPVFDDLNGSAGMIPNSERSKLDTFLTETSSAYMPATPNNRVYPSVGHTVGFYEWQVALHNKRVSVMRLSGPRRAGEQEGPSNRRQALCTLFRASVIADVAASERKLDRMVAYIENEHLDPIDTQAPPSERSFSELDEGERQSEFIKSFEEMKMTLLG